MTALSELTMLHAIRILLCFGLIALLSLTGCFPATLAASPHPSASAPSLTVHLQTISPTVQLKSRTTTDLPTKTIPTETITKPFTTTPTPTEKIARPPTQPPTQNHPPLIIFLMVQNGKDEICTVQPNGIELTCLSTGSGFDSTPQWSPDGRLLAFLSGTSRATAYLSLYDYDSEMLSSVNYLGVTTFTWSPDGKKIAFTTEPETQEQDLIYVSTHR